MCDIIPSKYPPLKVGALFCALKCVNTSGCSSTVLKPPTAHKQAVLLSFLSYLFFAICFQPFFKWVVILYHTDLGCKQILFLLALYIFLYGLLISADRAYIVPSTPEMPVSPFVFHMRIPLEYHHRAFTFQVSHKA